jgi:hypothetical protein
MPPGAKAREDGEGMTDKRAMHYWQALWDNSRGTVEDYEEANVELKADHEKLAQRVKRLEKALRYISNRGLVFDAKGTWSKEVCEVARAALGETK